MRFMILMLLAGLNVTPASAEPSPLPVFGAAPATVADVKPEPTDDVVRGEKPAKPSAKKKGPEPICSLPGDKGPPREPAECLVGQASYGEREACCILLEDQYATCGIAVLVSVMEPGETFPELKDKKTKVSQVEQCLAEPGSEKISDNDRLACCVWLTGGLRTQCQVGLKIINRATDLMNRGEGCPDPAVE